LAGVPFGLDLLDNEADKTLLRAASAPLVLGRPFAAALRAAMMATFQDPAFRADCMQQRLECSDPKSGDEIAGLIRAAYETPADIRKRLIDIYQSGQGEAKK
jgi:hypothetical protein